MKVYYTSDLARHFHSSFNQAAARVIKAAAVRAHCSQQEQVVQSFACCWLLVDITVLVVSFERQREQQHHHQRIITIMTKKAQTAEPPAPPPPPQLVLDPQTTTPAMRSSLEELHSSLLCPLCHQVFVDPSTLACAHTFCLSCMDEYACNAWSCPVPGCGFPLTCRGSREGSYLKINPQIQTVVQSLDVICKTLNEAPKEWWNAEEEEDSDDGEVVDLQQYSPCRSERSHIQEDNPDAPDSEQTEAFSRPAVESTARHDWMGAIEEDSVDNRSCGLPSQSPNCSPIAIMASQASHNVVSDDRRMNETENNDNAERSLVERKESPTVRFEEDVSTMDSKRPAIPTVMVASALSSKDRALLDKLVEDNKMKLIATENESTADFAVCGNAEMETGDGYLVGRTYGYLLAVTRGIPIVNISYFQDEKRNLETMPDGNHKHQVIGEADSSEWMAPQRAIQNKRGKEGTSLLDGYMVFLFGDFDSMPSASKRSRSGIAKNEEEHSQSTYSSDRLERLLSFCGATIVSDLTSLVGIQDNDKVAVMLRPDPHPRDWRAARKELEDYPTLPLIRGNWLLDSISDFRVKEFDGYKQANASNKK